ncbi:uncharacterized protein [Solanum lycopersicum]|uniref:uncharacterized protein n=1 Tax=Solanum lycopersicum TaxID=4081 RepID=UPI003749D467
MEMECWSAMLHDNMDLSRLMVHVQQVEERRKKRGVRDARRPKPQDQAGPNHAGHRNNFGIREQPRFKKRHGTIACFGGGKICHIVRDCPRVRGQAGDNAHPRPNPKGAAAAEPPKRNMFCALKGREEQKKSAYLVTGMLQVFSTSVYALLDPWFALYLVTLFLALTFKILPEVSHDPLVVVMLLGENVRTDRVYNDCPIIVSGKTMCAYLVELPRHDFDVILGMDWLHSCYACLDCCSTVLRFRFPDEED